MLLERNFSSRLIAIGEVGLDYHYDGYDRTAQIKLFEETGLKADSLELVGVIFRDEGRSMYYSYIAKVSCDKDSIVLQEGETTDYKWVDKDGLLAYVNSEHTMTNHNKRYEKYFNTLV